MDEHGLGVSRDIRRQPVGPGRIGLRGLEKPFPGAQVLDGHAGGLRKALKDGLVYEHYLCGLCNGKDDQVVIYRPLLHEGRDEGGQLLLAEVVPIVHQNAVVGQRHHGLGI